MLFVYSALDSILNLESELPISRILHLVWCNLLEHFALPVLDHLRCARVGSPKMASAALRAQDHRTPTLDVENETFRVGEQNGCTVR